MKKIISIILLACTLFACTKNEIKSEDNNKEKVYKIGVLQFVEHNALDDVNEGFFKALDDNNVKYKKDKQNAGGEISLVSTISNKLVADKNDLIFAIATPAAQGVASLTEEIPIIVSAVTDPKSAGLVIENEVPGKNVTGTSDLTPVKEQISLLKKLFPEAKKVAMLYSSAEANSLFQIEIAHKEALENGLEYEDFSISSLNEIQSVVESMIGKVDVIYVPTDNMIASGMATVSMIATENKIPIIGAEKAHVDNGALATYGINYFKLGYKAGLQAIRVLEGEDIRKMPIEYLEEDEFEFSINEELAKSLKLDISKIK